jgi:hypothetical protein
MEMVMGALAAPVVAAIWFGDTETAKSAAGLTVRANPVECASELLAAWTVTLKLPAATVRGICKLIDCDDPAAIVKGVAGEEVTPLGSPESAMLTDSENPLRAAMLIVKATAAPPACWLIELLSTPTVKSGCGGFVPPPGFGELPQEIRMSAKAQMANSAELRIDDKTLPEKTRRVVFAGHAVCQ